MSSGLKLWQHQCRVQEAMEDRGNGEQDRQHNKELYQRGSDVRETVECVKGRKQFVYAVPSSATDR